MKKSFDRLCSQVFGCKKDAELALKNFQKSLKYHMIEGQLFQEILGHKGRGRPKTGAEKTACGVKIFGTLIPDQVSIEKKRLQKGRFILATNQLDNKETVPNQLKKQIKNPTMAWICEMFSGIGVVLVTIENHVQKFVTNLNDVLRRVIWHFGPEACRIYGI